jgi:hypothetical protein
MILLAIHQTSLIFKESIWPSVVPEWFVYMRVRLSDKKFLFFSAPELWYHCLMMPVLFPIGNWFFVGSRFFNDWRVFAAGTALVFVLYWLSIFALTYAVRTVIRWFPEARQAVRRTLVMFGVVCALTVVLATFDVWAYSLFPIFGTRFDLDTVGDILALGLVFDLFLCLVLNIIYTYARWQQHQTEKEALRRTAMQNQLDALKSQINPHFLFNSLNSLSSLISEDGPQAERFVDEMAKVYRYLLQANTQERTPLAAELRFLRSYAYLLETRYGNSLRIEVEPSLRDLDAEVPPQTLQILIDNAIRHNATLPESPLVIEVRRATLGEALVVRNNLQRKTRMLQGEGGLSELRAKYNLLGDYALTVRETAAHFIVQLPLLPKPAVA